MWLKSWPSSNRVGATCALKANGRSYTFTLSRDEPPFAGPLSKWQVVGERKTVEQPKCVKPWWFTAEDGSACLQVRYVVQELETGKGKNTTTLASKHPLVDTLNLVKQAAKLS